MRITCPNCDAQYEVDDNVIPKEGRDVQCSSCGQTWFQKSVAQLEAEGKPVDRGQPKETAETVVKATSETESRPVQEPDSHATPETDSGREQQKPDQSVLDILKEEAAHESEARMAEQESSLETQPDLGLDQGEAAQDEAAVSERTAKLRGIDSDSAEEKSSARRDLLPDIDEINSTLSASTEDDLDADDIVEESAPRKKSGFRMGFSLVIILATVLLLAYYYAPLIVERFPASKDMMASYVEKVDALRLWLDQMMEAATAKMSGLSSN